jgi:hypothetical protein
LTRMQKVPGSDGPCFLAGNGTQFPCSIISFLFDNFAVV